MHSLLNPEGKNKQLLNYQIPIPADLKSRLNINLSFGSVGFHITSALPLQTLKGIGLHHITSHDYNWDNNTRKNIDVIIHEVRR